MTRCSVASSIVAAGKVKLGSEVGLGDGVFILLSLSLGVSLRAGSERKADGEDAEDVCERVTRFSELAVAADVVASDAVVAGIDVGAAAASSTCSSSPQGHM